MLSTLRHAHDDLPHTASLGSLTGASCRASCRPSQGLRLDALISSELTRAIQTADAIAPRLVEPVRSRNADLNEGRPCLPEPQPGHSPSGVNAVEREHAERRLCVCRQ